MSVKNVPDVKEMHTISDLIYNTLISEAKRSHRKVFIEPYQNTEGTL